MPVEAHALDDQGLEMPGEEIGQVEGAGHPLGHIGERRAAGEELVAMRPGDTRHAGRLADPVDIATGAAIGIGDEDPVVMGPHLGDLGGELRCDAVGMVVQYRRKAGQRHVPPAIDLDQVQDLARQRAAPDNQGCGRGQLVGIGALAGHSVISPSLFQGADMAPAHAPTRPPRIYAHWAGRVGAWAGRATQAKTLNYEPAIWLCLRFMNSFAVSTATAASRQ